jgi:nucleotide-binding universal stress UspA family protein
MRDIVTREVVVGVSTAICLPALQAAAQEATRRRCGVQLLHVIAPVYASHPRIEELDQIAGELRQAGMAVLADAARTLEELLSPRLPSGDVVVSTQLCHGAVVSSLVEASTHACLLVLQQHDERPRLLSIIQAVTARADCPVLVVPERWHPEEPADQAWIVAGVDNASSSARVIKAALTEASRRHARLRLVHGVDDHPKGGDALDASARDAWLRMEHRALEADLSDLCGTRPGVAVTPEVVPQAPAAAVVTRSQGAALVVVGRGHSRLPFVHRPGPVTTDVLLHAGCPVLVVDDEPPGPAPRVRRLSEVAIP